MPKYRAVAKFSIHEGKADEFRQVAAQCLEAVKLHDPGTSLYEWFINEAGTECIVLETYDDAEALLSHARNAGPLVVRLLQIADCKVDRRLRCARSEAADDPLRPDAGSTEALGWRRTVSARGLRDVDLLDLRRAP
jgi:quinol monooxygenase YgiN